MGYVAITIIIQLFLMECSSSSCSEEIVLVASGLGRPFKISVRGFQVFIYLKDVITQIFFSTSN
jgi:hypothetical protein